MSNEVLSEFFYSQYTGKKTEIDFYVDGRLDRLVRRVEVVGEKVTGLYTYIYICI
jgi:hypothetical protein